MNLLKVSGAVLTLCLHISIVRCQICENDPVYLCATTENKLNKIADHVDIYRCILNRMGQSVVSLGDWCRIQGSGKVCIEEELKRSQDKPGEENKRLALQGILNFYDFTCKVGGTNDYNIHRTCVYQSDNVTPRDTIDTCTKIYWSDVNTFGDLQLCPEMINLLRCIKPIMSACSRHALSWMRMSLYNFLLPTAMSKNCAELENHTTVGYPYDKMCSAESLEQCIKSMFSYTPENPIFPDITGVELALKTNDDLAAWCGNRFSVIGCLNEKKVLCNDYDATQIEGVVSVLQYVCNDASMDRTIKYVNCLYKDNPHLEQTFRQCEAEALHTIREDTDLSKENVCDIEDDTMICKRNKAEEVCGEDVAEWQHLVEKTLTKQLNNAIFSCNTFGNEIPLFAIIATAVIAGMLLVVIIIVCVCCCACLDNKGAKSKKDLPKQDLTTPNAYTLLMNSKPMKEAQRDSDAHAYDNVMDAIDAETLEKKKSSRRPYPVVTPTGQINEQVTETDETSKDQVYEPRSSVSSDPYAASFLSGGGQGGGGPLVNKESTATRQSSNLAPSSINRDSLSKDSEGMYPSLNRTDSCPSKRDNSEKHTSSNVSMAFGAMNPAYRQSFRESENTSDMRSDYHVAPDNGLRQSSSVFATKTSRESPSLSRLRESFSEKSRRSEKSESLASGDYYPLMHERPKSPARVSPAEEESPVSRKISIETYLEQASVVQPEKKRESFVLESEPEPDYDNDEDSKGWEEYEKDKDRKVSQSTNLKTIDEDARSSPINRGNRKDMAFGQNDDENNGSKRESFNIEKHVRETFKPKESQQRSSNLSRQISEHVPSRNSADSYVCSSSFQEGFVPNAPPPPMGKSVPPPPPAATSTGGSIPQPPPPPPLPGYIAPTL